MSESTLDWCSFFALFWNDKGFNLKLKIPDTVLLRNGHISAWWATDKKGHVKRHQPQKTTWEAIRSHFVQQAVDDSNNVGRFVAIVRKANAPPRILKWREFNHMCEWMSDNSELTGAHLPAAVKEELPFCVQVYVPPHLDLRYITTYICNGSEVVCSSFPRRYSRRYIQSASSEGAGELVCEVDPKVVRLDANLKRELQNTTSEVVKYVERAHGLTLAGVVCEYVRDARGEVRLTAVLRAEWATRGLSLSAHITGANLTPGRLLSDEEEEEEQGDAGNGMSGQDQLGEGDDDPWAHVHTPDVELGDVDARTFVTQHRLSMEGVPGDLGVVEPEARALEMQEWSAPARASTSRAEYLPRSNPAPNSTGFSSVQLDNSWPSDVHHRQPIVRPRSARPPGRGPPQGITNRSSLLSTNGNTHTPFGFGSAIPNTSPAPSAARARPASAHPRLGPPPRGLSAPNHPQGSAQEPREAGRQGGAARPRSASSSAGPSGRQVATAGWPSRPGQDMLDLVAEVGQNVKPRQLARAGKPVLQSQIGRELDAAQDELAYQHELAQASAEKVRNLEREREHMVNSFNSRVAILDGTLYQCKQQQADADSMLRAKEGAILRTRTEIESLEEETAALKEALDDERLSMMEIIHEYHEKETALELQLHEFEERKVVLMDAIKLEKEAVLALRKQADDYQHLVEMEKKSLVTMPRVVTLEPGGDRLEKSGNRRASDVTSEKSMYSSASRVSLPQSSYGGLHENKQKHKGKLKGKRMSKNSTTNVC